MGVDEDLVAREQLGDAIRGNQSSSELIRGHHLMGVDEELFAREQLGDAIEAR
jgi:hypothetical protein